MSGPGTMIWSVPVSDGIPALAQKVADMRAMVERDGCKVISVSHAGPVVFEGDVRQHWTVMVVSADA